MTCVAIITAAGRGTRAGGELPKQWQMLAGKPVLAHTLLAFAGFERILVIHPEDQGRAQALLAMTGPFRIVTGGDSRTASVRAALMTLQSEAVSTVLIHDGARPLVSSQVIARVLSALETAPAAAPALAVSDALWRGGQGGVQGTQDRQGLYRAQTPQGFDFPSILAALILLAHTDSARMGDWTIALVSAWGVSAVILMFYKLFTRILGEKGLTAVERLMGMVLVMISVQMFLDGISNYMKTAM